MTAAAPSAKTKQTTDYVVIREAADDYLPSQGVDVTSFAAATLAIVGTFNAASASDAVKQAAGDKEGVYRAIPTRSWKPITVTVKTETRVTLS